MLRSLVRFQLAPPQEIPGHVVDRSQRRRGAPESIEQDVEASEWQPCNCDCRVEPPRLLQDGDRTATQRHQRQSHLSAWVAPVVVPERLQRLDPSMGKAVADAWRRRAVSPARFQLARVWGNGSQEHVVIG